MKASAILLAGGSGSRLRDPSGKKKQYLMLGGKPVMCWSLELFERSELIEEIVLVVPAGEEDFVRKEILGASTNSAIGKVRAVVAGGDERWQSVYAGLKAVAALHADKAGVGDGMPANGDVASADSATSASADTTTAADVVRDRIVFIHDAARPFVTEEMLSRLAADVQKTGACVLAVRAKDTIKRADAEGFIAETLRREELWQMQTPQVFRLPLVLEAHERLAKRFSPSAEAYGRLATDAEAAAKGSGQQENASDGTAYRNVPAPTDDAAVVALAFPEQKILLTEGSYRNIKITTPEDLVIAEALIESGDGNTAFSPGERCPEGADKGN